MKKWLNENPLMGVLVVSWLVVALIAGNEFLFISDEGGITGLQTLGQAGSGFWIPAILGTLVAGVITYFLTKKINNDGGYGKATWLIPILLLLSLVWMKGCEDKANNAVTTKKGAPVKTPVDSTRIPAEDLLPK